MNILLTVLKWIGSLFGMIFGTQSFTDHECSDTKTKKMDECSHDPQWVMGDGPLVKYELVLKHSPNLNSSLVYIAETKNIEMKMSCGLQYDLEMSSRILTKINNRLEKHNEIELPKERFEEWKAHLIDHLGEQAFQK